MKPIYDVSLKRQSCCPQSTVEKQQEHLKSGEETQTAYLDQIEELTHKLTQAENKIQTYESSKLEDGAKV